jgi:hypothetical protein
MWTGASRKAGQFQACPLWSKRRADSTSWGSLVRAQYRPPPENPARGAGFRRGDRDASSTFSPHVAPVASLYDVIVHRRLVHRDDPELNAHVHAAIAMHSRRGWRLDKADRSSKIDAVVALAMAVNGQAFRPEPVELVGWL